jgi:predicted small lipoprotein YifL
MVTMDQLVREWSDDRFAKLPAAKLPFVSGTRHGVRDQSGDCRSAPMHTKTCYAPRRSALIRFVATSLLLTLAACGHLGKTREPPPDKNAPRAQLSIGYSLLYQEADGLPKLNWILMFKDKPEEMGRVTNDLVSYYGRLADTMQSLSKQYPAMRIDVTAMSEIEGEERKSIGVDLAKDFAPLIGKTGVEFEREALLMFYNTLNEQRHLTGVMVGLETDAALRQFLETTKAQLEARYAKVGALLNRRYFTH